MFRDGEYILVDNFNQQVDVSYEFLPATFLPDYLPNPHFDPANMRIVRPHRVYSAFATTSVNAAASTETAVFTISQAPWIISKFENRGYIY